MKPQKTSLEAYENMKPKIPKDKEVWKDVLGYENLYMVSSLGRVKSLDRVNINVNGVKRNIKSVMLKQAFNGWYYNVCLCSPKIPKRTLLTHRLVALAFLENNDDKKCVNHIDGNKLNNKVENLEWCTHSENEIHKIHVLNNVSIPNMSNLLCVDEAIEPIQINGKNCYGIKTQKLYKDLSEGIRIDTKDKSYGCLKQMINELRSRFGVGINLKIHSQSVREYYI